MLSKSCTLSNYGNKQFFEWIKLTDYPLQRRPHEQDTFCPIFNHRIGLICDSRNSIFVQSTIWSCEEFRAGLAAGCNSATNSRILLNHRTFNRIFVPTLAHTQLFPFFGRRSSRTLGYGRGGTDIGNGNGYTGCGERVSCESIC